MKLVNAQAGWSTEGKFITLLPLGMAVDARCMLAYYGLKTGDLRFESLANPSKYSRAVLMKESGTFVVVPLSPAITGVTT